MIAAHIKPGDHAVYDGRRVTIARVMANSSLVVILWVDDEPAFTGRAAELAVATGLARPDKVVEGLGYREPHEWGVLVLDSCETLKVEGE